VSPFRPSFPLTPNLFPCSSKTLSPFSTAFLPRANSSGTPIRAVSPLFIAFTPNRSLTPLSTAFTQNDRVGYRPAISATGFLCVLCALCGKFIVLTLLQILSSLLSLFLGLQSFLFNILHALLQKRPGWGTQSTLCGLSVSVAIDFFPLCFHVFTKPLFSNSFACTSMQNQGGVPSPRLI
jgi:hypothetical protein